MHKRISGVTLLELLIAIALLSVIVIGFSSIDLFSRYHVLSSDRRAKLQNEVSFVLEHMSKNIARAIGDTNNIPIDRTDIGGNSAISISIDSDNNGRLAVPPDVEIAYRNSPAPNYQIWYYNDYTNYPGSYEIIAHHITSDFSNNFVTYCSTANFIDITLTACWNPDGTPNACGTLDNPSVTMRTRIKMPSVSTN